MTRRVGKVIRPRLPWCWVCSRRLHGREHRIALIESPVHDMDHEVVVHVECAEREGLRIKEGAHVA